MQLMGWNKLYIMPKKLFFHLHGKTVFISGNGRSFYQAIEKLFLISWLEPLCCYSHLILLVICHMYGLQTDDCLKAVIVPDHSLTYTNQGNSTCPLKPRGFTDLTKS